MFLVAERDFTCRPQAGFLLCTGRTPQVIDLFVQLRHVVQKSIRAIAASRGQAPPADLPPSFGPSLVAATQAVLAALNRSVPIPEVLVPILSYQATDEQLIQRVAERAGLILDYIARALALKPNALQLGPPVPLAQAPKFRLTKGKLLTLGVGAAATTGLIFLAVKTQRRASGTEDASHLLPDDDDDE